MPLCCRILAGLACCGFLLLADCSGGGAVGAEPRRPNIIFILADDLGYSDLGCYGSKYHESPHIDRLAAGGLRCTEGYSCGPNCQPTRAALLTGQYGPRTGIYTVGGIHRFDWQSRPLKPVENVTALPLGKRTIAQQLREAGYVTGMFGKWHLGNRGAYHPAQRGFDEALVSAERHFKFQTDPPVAHSPETYLADFLTDRAIDFIQRHRDESFFLYLPHFGVHSPFEAKSDWIKHFRKKQPVGGQGDPVYAAMLASVDESVGRISAKLAELNLTERTLVIFSSDNGGVGGYARLKIASNHEPTDNAPLRGGKGMLYEGGIRVPWIFSWPGKIKPGTHSATPLLSVDLYPTLLEAAGAAPPADYPLDGVSLLSLITKEQPPAREAIYWHFPGYLGAAQGTYRTFPVGAVRRGDWKLLEFFEDNRLELYNLKDDFGETRNLATSHPEQAAALHSLLKQWRADLHAPLPTPNPHRRPPKVIPLEKTDG